MEEFKGQPLWRFAAKVCWLFCSLEPATALYSEESKIPSQSVHGQALIERLVRAEGTDDHLSLVASITALAPKPTVTGKET